MIKGNLSLGLVDLWSGTSYHLDISSYLYEAYRYKMFCVNWSIKFDICCKAGKYTQY